MARKVAAEPEEKQQGLNGIERALDVLALFTNSDSPTLGVTEMAATSSWLAAIACTRVGAALICCMSTAMPPAAK